MLPHQWVRLNRGEGVEREKGCNRITHDNFCFFSCASQSRPKKRKKKKNKKEVGWVSVSTETFNNALKCHDCLLTWTEWPVCTSSPSYHYNEMSSFFYVCVCVFSVFIIVFCSHTPFYQMDVRWEVSVGDGGDLLVMTLSLLIDLCWLCAEEIGWSVPAHANSVCYEESPMDTKGHR